MKEGASRSVLRGIVQYDTLNEVNIRLSDGSKAFNYDGYTNIIFKVLKPDGTAYVNSSSDVDSKVVATSPVDGIVTVMLGGQATTAIGLCQSVIEIYEGSDVLTTARFNYEVFEGLNLDDAVESSTEYPVLNNLISEVSALEAAIEVAEAKRVAAEAVRANEASGYVSQANAAKAAAQASAAAAAASAAEAQAIASADYATNSGSQTYTNNQISTHNKNTSAHSDIRTLITNANAAAATAQATATAAQTAAATAKAAADAAQTKANSAATAAQTAQTTANGKAAATHYHAATDVTSGILPVARGGTGVATIADLATALASSLGSTKVVAGTYSGGSSGDTTQEIELGFTPKGVLVICATQPIIKVTSGYISIYGGLATTDVPANDGRGNYIEIVKNGFEVSNTDGDARCNYYTEEYNYIAVG